MSSLSIDALLEDLRDDGTTESSGSFTLDPAKAEEKLRQFALHSPHDYILKVVQCAVACGAPEIEVKARPLAVEITFGGEPISKAQIRGLMAHLLTDAKIPENRRFRHLAAGMRGATVAKPTSLRFEAWDGKTGFARVWDSEGWRLEDHGAPKREPYHCFRLSRTASDVFGSLGQEIATALSGKKLTEEEAWLAQAYQFSPAGLTLDGSPLPSQNFGMARYPGYDITSDPHPGESKPPPYLKKTYYADAMMEPDHHLVEARYPAESAAHSSLHNPPSEATIRLELTPGGPERCRAWLAIAAHLREPEVIYVEDGLRLSIRKYPQLCPGLRGVISASHLNKDLTGFKIVEDQLFRDHMAWLEAESERFRQTIMESLALFPNRDFVTRNLQTP